MVKADQIFIHPLPHYCITLFAIGILLRNGYWYDIVEGTWETLNYPPNAVVVQVESDAFFSFRGRPTMFGTPTCDDNGQCEWREVIQYNTITNEWDLIGHMADSR